MKEILVLYYSRTGNTEKMAKAVAEGAQTNGKNRVALEFHIEPEELSRFDAIVVGTPTYHHEMPIDFKKLFEEAAMKSQNLKGKIGATFGSYGWSGEAPGLILEIMKNRFDILVIEPPLLGKYVPDEKILAACKDLGKRISEKLEKTT